MNNGQKDNQQPSSEIILYQTDDCSQGVTELQNVRHAGTAKAAGVKEPRAYAILQGHGYCGLCGGKGGRDIHRRNGLKKEQQILDHMGRTELAANLFRASHTEEKCTATGSAVRPSPPDAPRGRREGAQCDPGTRRDHYRMGGADDQQGD